MERKKDGLSPADRAVLRKALESKRTELLRASEETLAAATHTDDSLADPMDAATRATEEAELLGLADHDRALLVDIDRALGKLADGTYGASEASGRPIPLARLRALPWARLTAEEEEERERVR